MELKLSGIQPFTVLDYPGKLACIAFLPGCNFRCGYCHNSEFVLPQKINTLKNNFISQTAFFNFLDQRKGKLDGVVISGGEPTIHLELPELIKKIKLKDFLVKLDTNGSNPHVIKSLISNKLIDYIALDIKGDDNFYKNTCKYNNFTNIKKTIQIIEESSIMYQFRSTLIKELHSKQHIEKIKSLVTFPEKIIWQKFRVEGSVLDDSFLTYSGYTDDELQLL